MRVIRTEVLASSPSDATDLRVTLRHQDGRKLQYSFRLPLDKMQDVTEHKPRQRGQ